ncbi:MAG: hypothetical protein COB37_03370 [Kordiimonadales bacterium]|nr:MAG: hypothetical protein COB37_03370 [Kordiimonadales bacterium]
MTGHFHSTSRPAGLTPKLRPYKLPETYVRSLAALRPSLMQALRTAVASGDAPAAHKIYHLVAGADAAEKLSGKNELANLSDWLSTQY